MQMLFQRFRVIYFGMVLSKFNNEREGFEESYFTITL